MADLSDRLQPTPFSIIAPQPTLFRLGNEFDQKRVEELLGANPDTIIIDTYQDQLEELFSLDHPDLYTQPETLAEEFKKYLKAYYGTKPKWQFGVWAHLPWRQTLLHLLESVEFRRVRTARNRNLITEEEQRVYYNATIGIAGLSVGNSCALALVLSGGGRRLHLADPETLKLTNLNRIRGSVADLTAPKVHLSARQIYELDPYAELALFPDGITDANVTAFFDGPPKLDILIDEVDNAAIKLRLREEAKKRRIPVIMAADNGDGGILEVERYDLNENLEPFHGRVSQPSADTMKLPTIGNILTDDFLQTEDIAPRMKQSLLEIGTSIPIWPQLGTAALLNGMAVATVVRKILTKQPVTEERVFLTPDAWLVPGYGSPEAIAQRQQENEAFVAEFTKRFKKRKFFSVF